MCLGSEKWFWRTGRDSSTSRAFSETLREPASSSSADFRTIATRDSKKPFDLAVIRAELKASGSIPGNLWCSEETLAGDNTGAGMLAQIINSGGISVRLINSVQDPAKHVGFVTVPAGSQKHLWGSSRSYTRLASSIPFAPFSHAGLTMWITCGIAGPLPPCSPPLYICNQQRETEGLKN